MLNNTIKIEGNGNIVIQDSNNSCITINANDTDVFEKIQQLSNEQIAALQQIINEQADKFSELFKTLINGVASQKNVVQGSITATSVRIGDDKHYHYTATKLPKELTSKIPCLDADKIIGRTNELDELYQMLHSNKQVVVMNGLGGIGKTTLAQVYARKYWDDYKHIAWITQTTDDVQFDFANEQALFHNLAIGKEFTDTNAIFNELVRKLKSVEEQPNLLIIDNADASLEKLRDKLPHQPQWHILITSRQELNGFTMKQLDFLSLKDALLLFKTHYTRKKLSDEQINELIKSVDLHTLTIEILAKTAMKQRYDYDTLKKAILFDAKANINIARPDRDKIERITSYLSSIFDLSNLNENESWLMKQFACLPPEFHTYRLLNELIIRDNEKREIFAETIEELCQKGWLLKNTEADSYKMHRIIKEVVKKQLPISIEECSYLFEMITNRLNLDQTKDNPIDKFQWIPFGNELLALFEVQQTYTTNDENKISRLQNNLAMVLRALGDYEGAKELLEKAKISAEKNFGADHPSTATRYSNLALVLQDLGDYEGAKELLEKAMISDEKNFGADHPSTAISYSNLALVLQDLGDYEGAKELLEKAMISDEKNFRADHPSSVIRYSNLAMVLRALGDYEGAKELLEKAMISDEKNFGAYHPSTTTIYSNLAMVLKALGDYEGAKELLEKAMISDEKNFGADHPSTATRYSNLALVLQDLGDYKRALKLSDKAVAVFQKVLPAGHPNIKIVIEINDFIKQQIK